MHMIFGSWLVAAIAGEGIAINETIKQGVSLGTLAPAAIWALVALISVVGLVKLYWDNKKDQEDLKTIIKETSTQISKNSEVLESLAGKIDKCKYQN